MTLRGHVHSNLVGSAGLEGDLEQGCCWKRLDRLVVGDRVLAALDDRELVVGLRVAADRRLDGALQRIEQALRDLHDAGCELITITQYLRPTPRHHPVERWVKPEEFVELADVATDIGFAGVMSGPLVRSSYRAGRLYEQALAARESGDRATITVT